MNANDLSQAEIEETWRRYMLTGEYELEKRHRRIFRYLPGSQRCKFCYAPFEGLGSAAVRLVFGKQPSTLNPQLCDVCERFARKNQGGTEIELSLLFVDVRGSTEMAERMNATEFSRLINRLYVAATKVLIESDGLIDKLAGDQVAGMFVPGVAGPEHANRALEAARAILAETGHADRGGPWIPLGAGVHTGVAFVGSVGAEDGACDITVLGDPANTAARLSSQARAGEILISQEALAKSAYPVEGLEMRQLNLKGKSKSIAVAVLRAGELKGA